MTKSYYRRCYPDRWVEVPNARPVTIPGWEHLDLFAYRDGHEWCVVEARSGSWFSLGSTKRAALTDAQSTLERLGEVTVSYWIAWNVTDYGRSPRYQESEAEET